eukprot:jgi/Bigna1/138448/aug1.45_g13156
MILHTANKDSRTYQQEKDMEISVDIVAEDNMIQCCSSFFIIGYDEDGRHGGSIITFASLGAASGISSSNRSKSSTPRSLTTSEGDGTSSAHLRILFKKSVSEAAREYFQSFEKVELGRRVLAALDIFGNSLRPEVTKIIVRLGLGVYFVQLKSLMDVPDARRMLGEIVNASSKFGLSPKQLRQLSTVAMNSKPTRRVKDRFGQIIREFLASNDVKEVARSFIEMKAPHFGHQLIKTALSMAMDRSRKDLVKVNKLVADLHSRKAVKPQEMFQGFEKLLQILEELSMDVPDASDQLEEAITSVIVIIRNNN